MSIRSAAPVLFPLVVGIIYQTVIFRLYELFDDNLRKGLVVMLALGVKIVGNKVQLAMLEQNTNMPRWMAGQFSYFYEFATSLLCRVMLAALPDADIAKSLSLLSTALEVAVRVWFYGDYTSEAVNLALEMDAKQPELTPPHNSVSVRPRYLQVLYRCLQALLRQRPEESIRMRYDRLWRYGEMRVLDGIIDQNVEYGTPLVAACMLHFLLPTGVFALAGTTIPIRSEVLLSVLVYQLGPEAVVDTYMVMLEVRHGLIEQYKSYLQQSPCTLLRSALLKMLMTAAVTTSMMVLCIQKYED